MVKKYYSDVTGFHRCAATADGCSSQNKRHLAEQLDKVIVETKEILNQWRKKGKQQVFVTYHLLFSSYLCVMKLCIHEA